MKKHKLFFLLISMLLYSCEYKLLVHSGRIIQSDTGFIILSKNLPYWDLFIPCEIDTVKSYRDNLINTKLEVGFQINMATEERFKWIESFSDTLENKDSTTLGVLNEFYIIPTRVTYNDATSSKYRNIKTASNKENTTTLPIKVKNTKLQISFDSRAIWILDIDPLTTQNRLKKGWRLMYKDDKYFE